MGIMGIETKRRARERREERERETSTEQHYFTMPVSKRYAAAKSSKYNSNIHKRNNVTDASQAKKYPFTVGPIVLAFFLFVILGSSILEVIMSIGRGQGM